MDRFARIGGVWIGTCIVGGAAVIVGGALLPSDVWLVPRLILIVGGSIAVLIGAAGLFAELAVSRRGSSVEDARGITGTIEFSPFLLPTGVREPEGVWFQPMVRMENKGSQPVLYLIQRFDVKIQTYSRVWKTDEPVGDEEMMARYLAPETGSRPPTSAYTIAPGAYMDAAGPTREFGPYPGLNPIDVECEIIVRLSRPFARSTVVEHRFFAFRPRVQDGRTLRGMKGGPLGAEAASFTSEQEPPVFVRRPITADFPWPHPPSRISPDGDGPKP